MDSTQPGRRAPLQMAFVITLTMDGPYIDGAAVLGHSIRTAHSHFAKDGEPSPARAEAGEEGTLQPPPYVSSLVALTHPTVSNATRAALALVGFRVLERPTPVAIPEIRGSFLRQRIVRSGCCGATELMKLWAWSLVEYDRVLLLDTDSIVLRPIPLGILLRMAPGDLAYTYDYGMGKRGLRTPPIQGGFLLVRPSPSVLAELLEIVREGDFRPGSGWGGSNIGHFWGGVTVQGLLPYYYTVRADRRRVSGMELDRCVFNNMADNPRGAEYAAALVPLNASASGAARDMRWQYVGPDCRASTLDAIRSAHFTICSKPWNCRPNRKHALCLALHARWHSLRAAFVAWRARAPHGGAADGEGEGAADAAGGTRESTASAVVARACRGGYKPLDLGGSLRYSAAPQRRLHPRARSSRAPAKGAMR